MTRGVSSIFAHLLKYVRLNLLRDIALREESVNVEISLIRTMIAATIFKVVLLACFFALEQFKLVSFLSVMKNRTKKRNL